MINLRLQVSSVKIDRSKYKKKQQATNQVLMTNFNLFIRNFNSLLKISWKRSSNSRVSNNYIKKLYLKNYPLETYVKYPNYF